MKKPNVIIILAEDICPNLGCYGDINAKTPNLDQFAQDNIKFNYCYSVAPVCSAARTSLNLGVTGPSAGVGNHRSMYPLPPHIKNFGDYMQEAGYYTVIGKTDLNFPLESGYNEVVSYTFDDTECFTTDIMQNIANAKDKPFFLLQTNASTHQSQYGFTEDRDVHRERMPRLKEEEYQSRENMVIPGYHFKTKEADEIWAQYHEKMTTMDRMFGELILALKKTGVYEDSILIFAGDNGHGIPSGKINLWNEGVHVPMIVHLPKELEGQLEVFDDGNGRGCDRLVSFVDFLATALSISDQPIPAYLQGKAFLGDARVDAPNEIFSFSMRVDEVFENSRSIHKKDIMYTCDFGLTPYRRLNVYQTTQAPWFVRSMIVAGHENHISDVDRRALFRQIPRVKEQLFDLKEDAFSLINFASERVNETNRLRSKMFEYIEKTRDDVFMTEALMQEWMAKTGLTPYEIIHDGEKYPLTSLIQLWKDGMKGKELNANVMNPCEKIIVTKFRNDTDSQFADFLYDESDVVSAYTAYRVGDVDRLKYIATHTENVVLIMFIVDMISNTRDVRFFPVYQVISARVPEFESQNIDARFIAGLKAGVNMLAIRLETKLPEDALGEAFLRDEKYVKSRIVLDTLDLY